MTELSNDAKILAGCSFGLPIGSKMEISYARPYAIWPRTRAAFAELVEAGYLTERTDAQGVHFKPSGRPDRKCSDFLRSAVKLASADKDGGLLLSAMTEEQVAHARHLPSSSVSGG